MELSDIYKILTIKIETTKIYECFKCCALLSANFILVFFLFRVDVIVASDIVFAKELHQNLARNIIIL